MDYIRLTTADADKVLSYFRGRLERENNAYEEFRNKVGKIAEEAAEKVAEQSGDTVDKEFKDISKEFVYFMAKKKHDETVNELSKYIEILTCGSEIVQEG